MCKTIAIVFAFAAAACGTATETPTTDARFSGTLTSCTKPNPRGGDLGLPDRQALVVVADDGAAFAERVTPTTTTSDGWTVDDAATVVVNDGTKLDVEGSFVENCNADGGCTSVPWTLKTTNGAGSFTDGAVTCNAQLK